MSDIKAIAFYLPQFHPVRENAEWWGPGFTEWTNVAKAKPNFAGHYQPHVPRDLGFYDLRLVENMKQQAEMARLYGLHGFCFYYYWFNGRRILELPLNNYLNSDIDFPFCVCWANENWTRTWDGREKDVLLEQIHSPDEDRHFLEDLIPLLKDPRAIKVDGKPMLLVYRADLFPNAKETVAVWRRVAEEHGLPGLHLCAVQFYGITDPRVWGFDAAVEFPPHTFIGPENIPDEMPKELNPEFRGGIVDYRKIMAQSVARERSPYPWYRGIIPSWDNTPRRQSNPHMIIHSSPTLYELWLNYLVEFTRMARSEDRIIFINAWNEWGEGCHLEPDMKHGLQYLEATSRALRGCTDADSLVSEDEDILRMIAPRSVQGILAKNAMLGKTVVASSAEIRQLRQRIDASWSSRARRWISSKLSRVPLAHRVARKIYRVLQ